MQHARAQRHAGGKVLNYICRKSAGLFIPVLSVKIILNVSAGAGRVQRHAERPLEARTGTRHVRRKLRVHLVLTTDRPGEQQQQQQQLLQPQQSAHARYKIEL